VPGAALGSLSSCVVVRRAAVVRLAECRAIAVVPARVGAVGVSIATWGPAAVGFLVCLVVRMPVRCGVRVSWEGVNAQDG
jgi:hypothetical protein